MCALKSDFFYELPEELIAQNPAEPRDSSRLMVTGRGGEVLAHDRFSGIAEYLNKGDLLILNDSKVFPARLLGKKIGKSGAAVDVEFLLLEQQKEPDIWETMVRPGRRLKKGDIVDFVIDVHNSLGAEILETVSGGNRLVKFRYDNVRDYGKDIFEILEKIGHMPLPPYITHTGLEKPELAARYNTVYADKTGSAAAPTAGLHFTERVFASLAEKGVETAFVTLHVGIGTFRPVKCERIEEHEMHSERYYVPADTARKIRDCKARGNRVVAVGTTSCRTLEAVGEAVEERIAEGVSLSGTTDIFITPGYEFKNVDALITNFHLPESTLLMLISAFMGSTRNALAAYEEAIRERYRFFSFGDSMLIL